MHIWMVSKEQVIFNLCNECGMITPEKTPDTFYRVSVKALILNEKKEFLLWLEDSWYRWFPWWWISHWEDHKSCLEREIFEEMWLETTYISDNPCYVIYGRMNSWYPYIQIFYEVKVKNYDLIASNECVELKFCDIKTAENMLMFINDVKLLGMFNPDNHPNV